MVGGAWVGVGVHGGVVGEGQALGDAAGILAQAQRREGVGRAEEERHAALHVHHERLLCPALVRRVGRGGLRGAQRQRRHGALQATAKV